MKWGKVEMRESAAYRIALLITFATYHFHCADQLRHADYSRRASRFRCSDNFHFTSPLWSHLLLSKSVLTAPTRLVPCHHNLALNMPASLKIASLMTDIVTFYVPLIQYFLKFLMTIRFLKNRKITSLFEYIIFFHTEINSVSLLFWIIVSLLRCHE